MKTEKEKMLAGELYNAFDSSLVAERDKIKNLLHHYNQLLPTDTAAKKSFLKEMLGQCGEQYIIEQPFYCDYGYNIRLGENFFSNFNCVILDEAVVNIGSDVLLGPNVSIYTVNHALNPERRKAALEIARPVTIGNNV
ncbi:MAG: sugar O-acetyltransferase, partial [Chitinophagaceae bacterium]